jgi:hypothetical protein
MAPTFRSVTVESRVLADRTVLAVTDGDRRSFAFGERVHVVGEDGDERVGVVTWDPVARWIVRIEDRGTRLIPW